MRAHHGKTGVDRPSFAFADLVDRRFHVVVNAATRNAAQCLKRASMSVKQHLVTLAGIGHQPKCAAGTELHVGDLDPPEQPTDQQTFFTPVELESLAQRERQRHKGSQGFSLLAAPRADECGQLAVAAVVALGFDLLEESLGGSAVVFGPKRIGFECLLQYFVERTELVESGLPLVHRLFGFGGSDPLSDSVSGQPGTLRYLVKRKLVAEVHPPNFSHHFHADHLVFSCSESEQKQLNTWVSFQSAEQPLMGQFSVSGNNLEHRDDLQPGQ